MISKPGVDPNGYSIGGVGLMEVPCPLMHMKNFT